MPTTKEYNLRLARLRSTRKITNTMKLVAVNKLRKARAALWSAEAFRHELDRAAQRARCAAPAGPLFQSRDPVRRVLVLVVTSDRGMCGGFNNNLHRLVARWLRDHEKPFTEVRLSFYGRRGHLYFKNRVTVDRRYAGLSMSPVYADTVRISRHLQHLFLTGQYDAIWVAYNRFVATGVSEPVVERFLPCAAEPIAAPSTESCPPLVEPSAAAVALRLAEQRVQLRLFDIFLQNAVGEQGARVVAMDAATRNVETLMETVTLLRNRARQAGITRELMEILGGAEAMRTGTDA